MSRVRVFNLQEKSKGLWVSGPRDRTPQGTLRRARGVHSLRERYIRSRHGSTVDAAIAAAHSLYRFNGVRFQGATTVLYRNAVSILTGLDGTRLAFAASNPRFDTAAPYLFVAGGGLLRKVDTAGAVTNWGIAAPSSGPWAAGSEGDEAETDTTVAEPQSTTIDTLAFSDGAIASNAFSILSSSSLDTPTGAGGLQCNTTFFTSFEDEEAVTTQGDIFWRRAVTVDLSAHTTSGDTSADEDYIQFYVQSDDWQRIDRMTLRFYLNGLATQQQYNYTIPVGAPADGALNQLLRGVTDVPGMADQQEQVPGSGSNVLRTFSDQTALLDFIGQTSIDRGTKDWQLIKIPKLLFTRTQKGTDDWADVTHFEFTIYSALSTRPNTATTFVRWDGMTMNGGGLPSTSGGRSDGGGGIQGTYKYKVTFLNSTTGNRSNGSPTAMVAKNVNRGYVSLTNIPVSSDAQVDSREIWRTVGNGNRYFKIATIADNTTTTFDDEVADFTSLDTTASLDPDDAQVMTSVELPTDNTPPDADFDDVIIDRTTAFWLSSGSGKTGRVYFSPIGRPESKKGFIDVVGDGNALLRIVLWAGRRFVFSASSVYEIIGDDPYISRRIAGIPGVSNTSKHTLASTPAGLVYQAADGVRAFNGSASGLVGFDPVGVLFRGEAAENLSAFEGVVATYAREEYLISDGTQCLAVHSADRTWRDLGFADITALFYEPDTDRIQAGRASNVQLIETEGDTDDNGSAIPFAIESPAVDIPGDRVYVIEDVQIEIDASGETITPTVIGKDGNITLSTTATTARATNFQTINRMVQVPGLRLTGSLAASDVTVYEAEFELHEVQLGLNFPTGDRRPVSARTADLGTNVVFDIEEELQAIDQSNNLFIIDRLTLELDTSSANVTPTIVLGNTSVALAAASNSARGIVEYEIDRVGPLNQLVLAADWTTDIQFFRAEIHLRQLELGITSTATGSRFAFPGRSVAPGTAIVFEIPPSTRTIDELSTLYFIERFTTEADTNGSAVTPSIQVEDGTSLSLTAVNTTSRQMTEEFVERVGPVTRVLLSAAYTSDIQIFGAEMHIRPVVLGIVFPDGNRLDVGGYLNDATSEIIFDIDPHDRRFDGGAFLPIFDRFVLEADTNDANISPTMSFEDATTITLDTFSSSARERKVYPIDRTGRLDQVTLSADYVTNAIGIYAAELYIRTMPLHIFFDGDA